MWGAISSICCLGNIYFECVLFERRSTWEDLLSKKSFLGVSLYRVMENFNCVCSLSERVRGVDPSSYVKNVESLAFNNFIV